MKNNPPAAFKKARDYAFLLLKFRPRSEKELQLRLQEKKFDRAVIQKTIAFLKAEKIINDADFTRLWIESRLSRPLGLNRLKQELEAKGVDKRIIEAEIKKICASYQEEDIVAKLAAVRFAGLKGIDLEKAKRRVFSYLMRRGFSQGIVEEVIHRVGQV